MLDKYSDASTLLGTGRNRDYVKDDIICNVEGDDNLSDILSKFDEPRLSCDFNVNSFGKSLLEMCSVLDNLYTKWHIRMRIWRFHIYWHYWISVIDYALASSNIIQIV